MNKRLFNRGYYSRIEIFPRTSGVYCIKNNFNGKVYIGSSIDTRGRIGCHLSLLRFNKHHNLHLQNAFNQCTIENFSFFLLEDVSCNIKSLREREQYWMDHFDSINPQKGYNISPKAEHASLGLIPWNKDSWKDRVSEAELISDYKSGLKITDISRKYHMSNSLIGKIFQKVGITRTKSGRPKGRERSLAIIKNIKSFYINGNTIRDCAKRFQIPASSIRTYLKDCECLRNNHFIIHPRKDSIHLC